MHINSFQKIQKNVHSTYVTGQFTQNLEEILGFLKGLSHEIFRDIFRPECKGLDLKMNRSQFTNFLRPPWIIGGHFYFLMRLRAEVLDTSGISNTDLQIFQFCDWWIFFLENLQQADKIYQRNFTNRKNPPNLQNGLQENLTSLLMCLQYSFRASRRHGD